LANELLEYTKQLIPKYRRIRFLDPAFGTGALYSALLSVFSKCQIHRAFGFEKDKEFGYEAQRLWRATNLELFIDDFTLRSPPDTTTEKANLIISNPPYTRHQNLTSQEKNRLRELIRKTSGIQLSGRTGLHGYFILLSDSWLTTNGLACWIIPSELMEVDYGREIRNYLLNNVTLLRIHRFDTTDLQFDTALVSSTIIIYKKTTPPVNHAFLYSQGGSLTKPVTIKEISANDFREAPRQRGFLTSTIIDAGCDLRISDVFVVKRGIATGANFYFILTPDDVKRYGIKEDFLLPILPPPRYVPFERIEGNDQGIPILEKEMYLLTCDLAESQVEKKYPRLWEYYEIGRSMGIHERYLCRKRSNWYSQEKRESPLFLFPYMTKRGKSSHQRFRFILNKSKAISTNSYLLLYPKPWFAKIIDNDSEVVEILWKNLNEIPQEYFIRAGRVYAKNLWKLEPSELKRIPLRINRHIN